MATNAYFDNKDLKFDYANALNRQNYQWLSKAIVMKFATQLSRFDDYNSLMRSGIRAIDALMKMEAPVHNEQGILIGLPKETVINDAGKEFGSNVFPTMPYIQFPFLLEAYNAYQATHKVEVIELGAATGRVAWKILTTGANATINDLYQAPLHAAESFIKNNLPASFSNHLTTIPGNALGILNNSPELKHKFDFVYSQNLIHFFNPGDCYKFAQVTWDLLKPGGKAYIAAQTFTGGNAAATYSDADAKLYGLEKLKETHRNNYNQILQNIKNGDNEFPSYIKTTNHKAGYYQDGQNYGHKFISVENPLPFEKVDTNNDANDRYFMVTHLMFERTLEKIFSAQGFLIKSITCGDLGGRPATCLMDALAVGDEAAAFNVTSVSIELEKPGLPGEAFSAEDIF